MSESVITVSISKENTSWGTIHVRAEGARSQAKQVAQDARDAFKRATEEDQKE